MRLDVDPVRGGGAVSFLFTGEPATRECSDEQRVREDYSAAGLELAALGVGVDGPGTDTDAAAGP
jgi:hypothetical protein